MCPADGVEIASASAICGSRPMGTNSVVPIAKEQTVSA
jgi:hypothetical protein